MLVLFFTSYTAHYKAHIEVPSDDLGPLTLLNTQLRMRASIHPNVRQLQRLAKLYSYLFAQVSTTLDLYSQCAHTGKGNWMRRDPTC